MYFAKIFSQVLSSINDTDGIVSLVKNARLFIYFNIKII